LDLIVRRALSNPSIIEFYKLDSEVVMKNFFEKQTLFFRMFPEKIGNASTLDWMLKNLMDGRGRYCPRDIIELLNVLKEKQILALERGFSEPVGEMLFSDSLFDEAFASVSKQKCKTVLYAEYPDERGIIDKLRNTNSEFTIAGLTHLWGLKEDEALDKAQLLMRIGLLNEKSDPARGNFEVPYLYRPGLGLSPGLYEY
jgi:hypothetical protein